MANNITTAPTPTGSYNSTYRMFRRTQAVTVKASGAETSSFNGRTNPDGVLALAGAAVLTLTLTASTAPTTLAVDIYTCDKDLDPTVSANWSKVGTFTTLGAVATGTTSVGVVSAGYLTWVSTIAGTSYTYSIAGRIHY